jgi:hypothetical protein
VALLCVYRQYLQLENVVVVMMMMMMASLELHALSDDLRLTRARGPSHPGF